MARRKNSFCSGSKWLRARTAREAVRLSDVAREFPEADIEATAPLGIFGKAVKDDTAPRACSTALEMYRPLLIDRKEARRLRVNRKLKTRPSEKFQTASR